MTGAGATVLASEAPKAAAASEVASVAAASQPAVATAHVLVDRAVAATATGSAAQATAMADMDIDQDLLSALETSLGGDDCPNGQENVEGHGNTDDEDGGAEPMKCEDDGERPQVPVKVERGAFMENVNVGVGLDDENMFSDGEEGTVGFVPAQVANTAKGVAAARLELPPKQRAPAPEPASTPKPLPLPAPLVGHKRPYAAADKDKDKDKLKVCKICCKPFLLMPKNSPYCSPHKESVARCMEQAKSEGKEALKVFKHGSSSRRAWSSAS